MIDATYQPGPRHSTVSVSPGFSSSTSACIDSAPLVECSSYVPPEDSASSRISLENSSCSSSFSSMGASVPGTTALREEGPR